MSVKNSCSTYLDFPTNMMSSKLHNSHLLKRPPAAVDWAYQSYLEMAQDLSHTDSRKPQICIKGLPAGDLNDSGSVAAAVSAGDKHFNADKSNNNTTHQTVTVYVDRLCNKTQQESYGSCTIIETHPSIDRVESDDSNVNQENKNNNNEAGDTISDNSDDDIHTVTTSSTDPNRKKNIFRYYETYQLAQQQNQPLLKLQTVEERNSSIDLEAEVHPPSASSSTAKIGQKPKKKNISARHCCKFIFARMRLSVEKPFALINKRFT
ncbi:hypothetical protein BDF20DRAFT_30428 [Mycotypha africana]|uniref:uncharacterized protein n=1 Tax=Mycotypha africana TaxID=64632 RepID=UPI0022FFE953|nr:uncharacterized protein BDF20DRAFT_30428 [Mycotypha africana]KAI8991219.1 hypothetical protein BDF20DRAFT_30428 [Mycotypha africana]